MEKKTMDTLRTMICGELDDIAKEGKLSHESLDILKDLLESAREFSAAYCLSLLPIRGSMSLMLSARTARIMSGWPVRGWVSRALTTVAAGHDR